MEFELFETQTSSAERIAALLDRVGHVALHGPAGVGKSTIACSVLQRWAARDESRRVVVVICEHVVSLDDLLESILSAADFRLVGNVRQELVARLNACSGFGFHLKRIETTLWDSLVALPIAPHHVFIGSVVRGGPESVLIEPLAVDESVSLLTSRVVATNETWCDSPVTRELVNKLDRLPGAIVLAAGRSTVMTPSELLARLHVLNEPSGFRRAIASCMASLSEDDVRALAALAQYAGAFSLHEAERMLTDIVGNPLRTIESLLTASAIFRQGASFKMLHTVRSFLKHEQMLVPTDAEKFVAALISEDTQLDRKLNWTRAWRVADAGVRPTVADRVCEVADEDGDHALRGEILDAWDEPDNPAYAWHRARACFDGDELELAIQWFQRAADGGLERAWPMWVEALRLVGKAKEATEVAARRPPTLQGSRHMIAVTAASEIDCGLLEPARNSMAEFLRAEDDPIAEDRVRAFRRAGYVHYFLGNRDEQRRMIEQAVDASADSRNRSWSTITTVALADCDLSDRQFARAIERYSSVLAELPRVGLTRLEGTVVGNLGGAWHRLGELDRARDTYARAIELHRKTGNRLYERDIMFAFGALEFECRNDNAAIALFESALSLAEDAGALADQGGLLICAAWSALVSSVQRDAVELCSRADRLFESIGEHENGWRAVSQFTRGLAGGAPPDPELLEGLSKFSVEREIVETLKNADSIAPSSAQLYVRLAQIVAMRMSGESVPVPTRVLVWDDVLHEIRLGGTEVSLRRRKALRLILSQLVSRRVTHPGQGFSVFEMFEIGWPGEEIHPDKASERVYWAVRELRKLGLESVIVTSDAGYLISEEIDVSRI